MKETKKEKTLKALQYAGEEGIHSFDGAYSISYRFAAYIGFLKKDGYNIISKLEKRNGCKGVRYFIK
jgi:hypothetical protein